MLETLPSGESQVKNMPLVAQGDPASDPEYAARFANAAALSADLGQRCYDACIAVLAATALSTAPGRSRTGRTKEFVSIANKTDSNGQTIERAIRQLSYQYGTALGGRPYYFHELLADHARILQGHDPRDYNVSVGNNPVATNEFGAAFRDWSQHSHFTNDYIRQLLERDFSVLIAYGGHVPTVRDDPGNPGKVIVRLNKSSGDQHKVVVSGLRSGSLPLRINNIFSRGRAWASLSSLTRTSIRSLLALSQEVTRIEFALDGAVRNWDSKTYLTTDWADADPKRKLFVVEHVDGVTLNYDRGTEVWRSRWGTGWSTLAPFTWKGVPHLIAYNKDNGLVHFDRLHTQGAAGVWSHQWGTGWSHIVPFIYRSGVIGNTTPRFFAYNSTTGLTHFNEFEPNLQGPIIKHEMRWGTEWTNFTPFWFDGTDHMIAYRKDTGLVHMDRLVPNGAETRWEGTWGAGWTHFSPFTYAGEAHFVAHSKDSGLTHLDKVDPALRGSIGLWAGKIPSAGVANCVAFADYSGPPHLISTHPGSTHASVQLSRLHNPTIGPVPVGTWSLDFIPTQIVPFRLDRRSYALFYNVHSGDVAIHTVGAF